MDVALTGATGFIGSHVFSGLREHGHEVTAFVRDDEQARVVAARGARPAVVDLYDRPAVVGSDTTTTPRTRSRRARGVRSAPSRTPSPADRTGTFGDRAVGPVDPHTTDVAIGPYLHKDGENAWAAVRGLLDATTAAAATPVIQKYTGVLAAADVFTTSTTFWVMESIRVEPRLRLLRPPLPSSAVTLTSITANTAVRHPLADHPLTPPNAASAVIDYQPSPFSAARSMDPDLLLKNIASRVTLAKLFGVPSPQVPVDGGPR